MIVVADTSPINYLVLIGQVDILGRLYHRVLIPQTVFEELNASFAPPAVSKWLSARPPWFEVSKLEILPDPKLDYLGKGERDAIALAQLIKADRLIVDESAARREASQRGIPIIGLLGILLEASRSGFLDLPKTVKALEGTSFFVSKDLIEHLLEIDRRRPR